MQNPMSARASGARQFADDDPSVFAYEFLSHILKNADVIGEGRGRVYLLLSIDVPMMNLLAEFDAETGEWEEDREDDDDSEQEVGVDDGREDDEFEQCHHEGAFPHEYLERMEAAS